MRKYNLIYIVLLIVVFGCNSKPETKEAESVLQESDIAAMQMAKLDSLTRLIDASPGDAALLHARSKAFLDVNQINFALADVGRALLIDSTKAPYYLTISDVYFRMNEPVKCKNALLKAN